VKVTRRQKNNSTIFSSSCDSDKGKNVIPNKYYFLLVKVTRRKKLWKKMFFSLWKWQGENNLFNIKNFIVKVTRRFF